MVWEQMEIDKAHIAYAVIGIFSTIFSLVSLFVKEKLYIGEATVAAIVGLIVGPHCLNWFAPTTWGNTDYITLEISRIALVVQIFAVAVELPKKYMLKHWWLVFLFLVPVMTAGWFVVGLFVWLLIPGLLFAQGLLVLACVTATDPVLAAAVVGKGKFARRVPGHLRNILSAESGCNDGMAFPFIFLSFNIVIYGLDVGLIIKDWVTLTLLYECLFGCILGAIIGYCGRHAIKWCEAKELIDRELFLAFYIVLSLICTGVGTILGTDDLLVLFAAGAAFSWDGWFARKTEELHVLTVIDLLLNLAYFVYFGAIIPWEQFNNAAIGIHVWKLVILAIVVIFLRRIPAVLILKPLIPDVKTWREALFCGHFGPIGVGAVFAAIIARRELEHHATHEEAPLAELPGPEYPYYQLIHVIWPVVTFLIITSIIVHGSSVAVMTLGKHLRTLVITMSFTKTGDAEGSLQTWLNRLPKLGDGRLFSLQRIDTETTRVDNLAGQVIHRIPTVETSGVPVRPAGGMQRRKKNRRLKKVDRKVPQGELFTLGGQAPVDDDEEMEEKLPDPLLPPQVQFKNLFANNGSLLSSTPDEHVMYQEGNKVILEDADGEITHEATLHEDEATMQRQRNRDQSMSPMQRVLLLTLQHLRSLGNSVHLYGLLQRHMTQFQEEDRTDQRRHYTNRRTKKHYYAYQLGLEIVIENDEGEVVRRYRMNVHEDSGSRQRAGSVAARAYDRALLMTGLRRALEAPPVVAPPEHKKIRATKLPFPPPRRDLDSDDPGHFDDSEFDLELELGEETAVERRRRLAALGEGAPRNADDEEE